MPSALEAANAKLSEDQFKTLFDNPRIGSHNNKEVLQWTYHNPNGSDETLWVPLKTKDNQSLPTSKVKNNIHNKCSEVKKQLAAPSIPHPNTVSQTSIHGRLQPTYQHSVSRGASSDQRPHNQRTLLGYSRRAVRALCARWLAYSAYEARS